MIDRTGKYEVSFFAPGTGVEATTEIMMKLLETFKDKGLLPTTIQEVVLGPTSKTRRQLCLTDNNSVWSLAFEPRRLLLTKRDVGIDLGTPDNFIQEAVDIFARLFLVTPLNGTRLSFVTKGVLAEMANEALEKANTNLLKPPKFYLETPPHQWSIKNVTRCDYKLGEKDELLNIITDISRIQGEFDRDDPPKPFDRIAIGFDINTYQKNVAPRFDIKDLENFLRKAVELSQQITNETEKIIYE